MNRQRFVSLWCVMVLWLGAAASSSADTDFGRIYWTTGNGIETAFYTIDAAGNLILGPPFAVLSGTGVDAALFLPGGLDIIAGAHDHLVRVPTSGAPAVPINLPGSNMYADHIAIDPSGLIVWSSWTGGPGGLPPALIEETALSTGAVTSHPVTDGVNPVLVSGLAFVDADGAGPNPPVLYITDNNSKLYTLDLTTFVATLVFDLAPHGNLAHQIHWDPVTNELYAVGGNVLSQLSITGGGAVSHLATRTFSPSVISDNVRRHGQHLFITNVDPTGGHEIILLDLQGALLVDDAGATVTSLPVADVDDIIPLVPPDGPETGPRGFIDPHKLNFGFVDESDSKTLPLTIASIGDSTLAILSISAPDNSPFDLITLYEYDENYDQIGFPTGFETLSFPYLLAPGHTLVIDVAFTPTNDRPNQDVADSLTILTDDITGGAVTVNLCGTTIKPIGLVTLDISEVFVGPGATEPKVDILAIPGQSLGGLQFDIDLSQVVFSTLGESAEEILDGSMAPEGFEVKGNLVDDGNTLKVVVFSSVGATIPAGSEPVVLAQLRYTAGQFLGTEDLIDFADESILVSDPEAQALGVFSEGGAIQVGFLCDVNTDGLVDIRDLVVLVAELVGRPGFMLPPEGVHFRIQDCNEDGLIDVADAIGIVNEILGIDEEILDKVIAGGPATVSLGSPVILADGRSAIPVVLEGAAVAGLQAVFTFDPSLVSAGAPVFAGDGAGLLLDSQVRDGQLRLVVVSLTAGGLPSSGQPVVYLPVSLKGAQEASLTLSGVSLANRAAHAVTVALSGRTSQTVSREMGLPKAFALASARPNPFNPATEISYEVPQTAHIQLIVFNLLGQEVVRLVDGLQQAGRYSVRWDGRNARGQAVSSGVYLYRMTASTGFSETRRMTLLK